MAGPERLRHEPGQEIAFGMKGEQAHRRLEQRAVHALAEPGLFPLDQGCADAHGAEYARREIEEGPVAAPGVLDLDDVGSQVAQESAAPGAGNDAGEVEHADAVEREREGGHARYYTSPRATLQRQ